MPSKLHNSFVSGAPRPVGAGGSLCQNSDKAPLHRTFQTATPFFEGAPSSYLLDRLPFCRILQNGRILFESRKLVLPRLPCDRLLHLQCQLSPGKRGVTADCGLSNPVFLCDTVGSLCRPFLTLILSASEEGSGLVRCRVLIMSTLHSVLVRPRSTPRLLPVLILLPPEIGSFLVRSARPLHGHRAAR